MEEYINKSALVEEIKRRMQEHHSGYLVCLKDILSFINTLGVLTLNDIKEMENQAFLHGIDVERNKNIFNDNKKIKI